MTIKERVLASMKTSYAKYGFKKDELSKLADIISANLKDESTDEDITATLTANEGYAQMMQSVYNRGVSETNDKYKDYIPKPKDEPTPPAPPTPSTEPKTLTAEDIQKLIAEGISKGLQPYKEREEKARLNTLLQGNAKLKEVPKIFRERYHLDKEEDAERVADQIVADYTELKQGLVQSGTFVEAPKRGTEGSEDDDFRKMMEQSAQRVAAKQAADAKASPVAGGGAVA